MKLPYQEGTWFGVPLRQGGFAVGLVARASSKGKIILCYFFGPRRAVVPELEELAPLKPDDAIRVFRVGDLSLIRNEWPIVGVTLNWKRSEWPMPPFVRRNELSRKAWRVYYSDGDLSRTDREEPEPYDSKLEADALLGAGAAEQVLTILLP